MAADQQILILGCGFLGQVLAQRLAFAGIPVTGTTRTQAQLGVIRTRGAEAVLFDGEDLTPITRAATRARGVVMCIPPGSEPSLDQRLIEILGASPVQSAVYISSTSVYGDRGGARVTEDDPVAPETPKARARVEAEALWRAAPFGVAVVRPSGIYGPGRSLLHRIASGNYRMVDGGRAKTNRIHVADLASLVVAALERPGTYLGSDLAAVPQHEVVDWIVQTTGWPRPSEMSLAEARVRMDKDTLAMFTQSKALDPSATLSALSLKLRYPSYREGFAALLGRERVALEALRAAAPA